MNASVGFLLVLLPTLGVFVLGVLMGSRVRKVLPALAIGVHLTGLVGAVLLLVAAWEAPIVASAPLGDWFRAASHPGYWSLSPGLMADASAGFLLVVLHLLGTGVLLVSLWYLHDDPLRHRFFGHFSLFTASMSLLVLADGLLMAFVGWELVGVGSYLLIGFWHHRAAPGVRGSWRPADLLNPANAQFKAFAVNRLGDVAFLAGMVILIRTAHSAGVLAGDPLAFASLGALRDAAQSSSHEGFWALGCILVLMGALSKSAQVPFHVWLPDAMQGPTTASAILHAATMVAAGVWLTARLLPVLPPLALDLVLVIGAVTCLIGAMEACSQRDIKGVLAWSTISQLGLMMAAAGVGAREAALAHLFTHAFFKSLLFLGVAVVLHGLHGVQDLHRTGGLMRRLPWTGVALVVGGAALAGLPGTSAFWSKKLVLSSLAANAEHSLTGMLAFGVVLVASSLTVYYIGRHLLLLLAGRPRDPELAQGVHDASWSVRIVLVALAILSLEFVWTGTVVPGSVHSWIAPALGASIHHAAPHESSIPVLTMALFGQAIGLIAAWVLHGRGRIPSQTPSIAVRLAAPGRAIDHLVHALALRVLWGRVAPWAARFDGGSPSADPLAVRSGGLDGLWVTVSRGMVGVGRLVQSLQSTRSSDYALGLILVAALLVCLSFVLVR